MKTQTVNSIFNLVTGMRKSIIKIILCTLFLSAFAIGHSHAGTWRDEFDEAKLNDWERIVKENPLSAAWETEGGLLIASIKKPKQVQVRASDFLRWKARQFQLARLTVVGEEIRYERFNQDVKGELSLFLGKRKPAPDLAEGYIFNPGATEKMVLSANGVYKMGKVKARYNDRFQLASDHLKVVFDTGKFQLFTQDILLTEFFDDEIVLIDVVGLIVTYRPLGDWSMASISTFSISGRDIPNHNSLDVQLRETQLTTTWGALKRSEQY